jgi:hypothetical protein
MNTQAQARIQVATLDEHGNVLDVIRRTLPVHQPQMSIETFGPNNPPGRIYDVALAMTVRALGTGLSYFAVIERCGRVVLVRAERVRGVDPIFPVPLLSLPRSWWRQYRSLIREAGRIAHGWADERFFRKWEAKAEQIARELSAWLSNREVSYFYAQLWKAAAGDQYITE